MRPAMCTSATWAADLHNHVTPPEEDPPVPHHDPVDVLVVGAGPTGRALAHRAVASGLTAAVLDPSPARAWPATYGAWEDELPGWLPPALHAVRSDVVEVVARRTHRLDRAYVVLDTPGLQRHLSSDDRVGVVTGAAVGSRRVIGGAAGTVGVVARTGETVPARVVVDASGDRRTLTGGRAPGDRAAQTAVGVVLDRTDLPTVFMDWSVDHGRDPSAGAWPTFLYQVPLGGGRVLLEETALARRPALSHDELRSRLAARLAARGIEVPADAPEEVVTIAVDTPRTRGTGHVIPFGAAVPLIHPATGYGLAAALRMADPVVAAIAAHLPDGRAAATAAREVLWPCRARLVHHLRRRGLEALLALPPDRVPDFFDRFFSLPREQQRAYLSSRTDLVGVARAQLALFAAADPPLRRHLLRWGAMPIGDAHA